MESQSFARRQVERSFRKFRDLTNDLFSSQWQIWGDVFSRLIVHCETDPVMRVVTQPLRTNKNVDARKWYADAMSSVHSMAGSGSYKLPHDDDDRAALIYQFL